MNEIKEYIERKPLKTAKFIKGFNSQEPVFLKLTISIDNKTQEGEYLQAFVDLANRHKKKLKGIEIILSCYLQRHYIGEKKASEIVEKWKKENLVFFVDLAKEIELIITSWKSIIETDTFKTAYEFVNKLYNEDSAFQTKVNLLAKSHSHKADMASAKTYLLEENAAFMVFKGHVTYPSSQLNAANDYIVKNYNKELIFHGYSVFTKQPSELNRSDKKDIPNFNFFSSQTLSLKSSASNSEDNSLSDEEIEKYVDSTNDENNNDKILIALGTAKLMGKFGIKNADDRKMCFRRLVSTCKDFAIQNKGIDNVENNEYKTKTKNT